MFIGLHRDPRKLREGGMSVFRAEMRRRLWLTILELNLQSAHDANAAPRIAVGDYDTLLPADLNDDEVREEPDDPSLDHLRAGGTGNATRMSVALALAKSFPLRLGLLQHANDLQARESYDETLRLNQELVQACHSLSQDLEAIVRAQSGVAVTQLHASLAELMAYRCFHALHKPFIQRFLDDPKYYFSQKMYIDGALNVAQLSGFAGPQNVDGNVTFAGTITSTVATASGTTVTGLSSHYQHTIATGLVTGLVI
ncbi:hypothetical protein QQZ08_012409 [Neonectria magnoliae]|uniref:Transcription factor domain-containing protein n=1 Tax=Neonectria magnoliae TaxID=2732573 RepID=A0ABR1H2F5_9HYPO